MPGFSRQEQQGLALLVRGHRRKMPVAVFEETATDAAERKQLLCLCLLLRLAVRLHHARNDRTLPVPTLTVEDGQRFRLKFPDQWLTAHPLSYADFEEEQGFFSGAGFELVVTEGS